MNLSILGLKEEEIVLMLHYFLMSSNSYRFVLKKIYEENKLASNESGNILHNPVGI